MASTMDLQRPELPPQAEEREGTVYKKLDPALEELRILEVQDPNPDTGRVVCHLETVSLLSDPPPEYEAISWCWGDAIAKELIELHGKVFEVPRSAEEVLRRLCIDHGHRRVFLDALCINQRDVNERSQQVALMGRVYSKAERTLVWLGQEEDCTAAAMKGLGKIFLQCKEDTNNFAEYDETVYVKLDDASDSNTLQVSDLPLPACDWAAIVAFFSAPWFTRMWVVQEVKLAKEVVYFRGDYPLFWNVLSCAVAWLKHRKYYRSEYCDGIVAGVETAHLMFDLQHRSMLGIGLLRFQATEPRDKLYGSLGLLQMSDGTGKNSSRLIPDYEKPLHIVFTAAVKLCIEEAWGPYQLDILSLIGQLQPTARVEEECLLLPSWVPPLDYRCEADGMQKMNSMPVILVYPGAADGLRSNIPDADNLEDLTLSLQGLEVDVLSLHLHDIMERGSETSFLVDLAIRLWPALRKMFPDDPTLETRLVFTLVQKATYSSDPGDEELIEQFRTYLQVVYDICAEREVECPSGKDEEIVSRLEHTLVTMPYVQSLLSDGRNRKLFLTNQDCLVMGPPGSREGDRLCILFGSRAPFLLRQEGDHWKLTGEAYVYGLMQGEYVRQLRSEGTLEEQTKEFEIH